MSNGDRQTPEPFSPAIHRGRIDRLTIFEVTEAELDTLERGSPVSVFLNLAIFVLSVATSFSASLLTTEISSNRTFNVFVIVTVVGYIAGATFLLLWFFTRKSIKSVVENIRKRLTPVGVPVSAPMGSDSTKD